MPSLDEAIDAPVADPLSAEEGRRVTVPEVRFLITMAMLKLRRVVRERGIKPGDYF